MLYSSTFVCVWGGMKREQKIKLKTTKPSFCLHQQFRQQRIFECSKVTLSEALKGAGGKKQLHLRLIWWTCRPCQSHWGRPAPGMVAEQPLSCALLLPRLPAIYPDVSEICPSAVSYPSGGRPSPTPALPINPQSPFSAFWSCGRHRQGQTGAC